MKVTHSKTASRRSHHRARTTTVVKTATGMRRMHFMDPVTGMYRGKQIVAVATPKSVAVAKTTKKKKVVTDKSEKAKDSMKKVTANADKKE